MSNFNKLIKDLSSGDTQTVVRAAHSLGDLGDRGAVSSLIDLLVTTTDPVVRNAAAVGLRELKDPRAVAPLISLVRDSSTEGHRGTLVYALGAFDLGKQLPLLVDLVVNGNFEVSREAFQAIEGIESPVDQRIIDKASEAVKRALDGARNEHRDLLEELLELLGSANTGSAGHEERL